jgi:hypothetical protein
MSCPLEDRDDVGKAVHHNMVPSLTVQIQITTQGSKGKLVSIQVASLSCFHVVSHDCNVSCSTFTTLALISYTVSEVCS